MSTATNPTSETVGVYFLLTPAVKARLRKRAVQQKSNMNDVAVAILATAFDVPFDPSGRVSQTIDEEKLGVNFKMPPELALRIKERVTANRRSGAPERTDRAVVLAVLAAGLGLKKP